MYSIDLSKISSFPSEPKMFSICLILAAWRVRVPFLPGCAATHRKSSSDPTGKKVTLRRTSISRLPTSLRIFPRSQKKEQKAIYNPPTELFSTTGSYSRAISILTRCFFGDVWSVLTMADGVANFEARIAEVPQHLPPCQNKLQAQPAKMRFHF